ncbi:uncharacterized protein LOC128720899 [Anopheles nili]|uniref:uncharacterized protein LOC128720899 n=1 Tax=Anopheles nili TaxID=185578 RepID=UPI00237BA2DC|nr:uncharacterized protein LOC128720899 [Anopheles nili]
MGSNFVSVFKLDGVPILPPVMNDEVRALAAMYRQKAIEIEKRLEERRRASLDTKTGPKEIQKVSSPETEQATVDVNNATEMLLLKRTADPAISEDPLASSSVEDRIDWQSMTRTVTPTSEESLPWLPLVRCNTYNLEKPSLDLTTLQETNHSTPIDHAKAPAGKQNMAVRSLATNSPGYKAVDGKSSEGLQNAIDPVYKETTSRHETVKEEKSKMKMRNVPLNRKTSSPKISRSSTGSDIESYQALKRFADSLTSKELKKLMKRQEAERLLLDKRFREKAQELTALCKPFITTNGKSPSSNGLLSSRTKTPELNPASSVSQLSLCDISYDSCTDTDEAAYHTCHANGTSEENVNNTLEEMTTPRDASNSAETIDVYPTLIRSKEQDANGNDDITLLPHRMVELQQYRAATIINAHVRGYLTRRLFKTEEVQSIKSTIVDIVCYIMSSGEKKKVDESKASIHRSAGKDIAFCLDLLHDIFVTFTTEQRMQMIHRDRCIKQKLLLSSSKS